MATQQSLTLQQEIASQARRAMHEVADKNSLG